MRFVPATVTRSLGKKVLLAKKNSPHIFFGVGLVGVVGGAALACKATLDLDDRLDAIKIDMDKAKTIRDTGRETYGDDYDENEYIRDATVIRIRGAVSVAKLYAPAIVVGGVGVAALTGSHIQLTRRNTALSMALGAAMKAYDEYRERVKEELGEDRELEIYHNVTEEKVEIDGKKELVRTVGSAGYSPYAVFFDETCPSWRPDPELNKLFLRAQQTYANHLLKTRGHVFLNDVYDSIGIDRTRIGSLVGWVYEGEGDGYIDFGLFAPEAARFANGLEQSVVLDFNVDGIVWDKI